jgi:prophage regulatory protein
MGDFGRSHKKVICLPYAICGFDFSSTCHVGSKEMAESLLRILRLREVKHVTGLGTTTIYREANKDRFPRQVPLVSRHVGWREDEVAAWVRWRLAAARNPEAAAKHWSAWLPKSDSDVARGPHDALDETNGVAPKETKTPADRDTSGYSLRRRKRRARK